jgi:hypothetical protein
MIAVSIGTGVVWDWVGTLVVARRPSQMVSSLVVTFPITQRSTPARCGPSSQR